MASSSNPVPRIYRGVIEDVINNVREDFLNEGVDEQVLNDLKQLWETKLKQSGAVDGLNSDVHLMVTPDDKEDDENDDAEGEEEEPLKPKEAMSNDDPSDIFETDNVVVCQYDKIARTRNRWKFYLKDGIMNLNSKDYVFHKANGDSEW